MRGMFSVFCVGGKEMFTPKKKYSWDQIPSLDGLGIDWEYKSEKALDKRVAIRLGVEAVSRLVEVQTLEVRVATAHKNYLGSLIDISAGGMALFLLARLEVDLPVKVGCFIGKVKIISHGLVRHVQANGKRFLTGIQFVGLDADLAEYLSGLYAAKVLYHSS